MKKILALQPLWLFILFVFLDTLCIGMGMGVPFFCILLGFVTGWFVVIYLTNKSHEVAQVFQAVLKYCAITAAVTFLAMAAVWVPFASYLFDPSKDLANTGIPLILYEPGASLIGWIVLMVLISPFLQLLTSLFSAYLAMLVWMKKTANAQKTV